MNDGKSIIEKCSVKINELNELSSEDYLSDLYIDQNNLDYECVITPVQIDKWSRLDIVAKDIKSDLESSFDVIKSKVELLIRQRESVLLLAFFDKNSDAFKIVSGGEKLTEGYIKSILSECPIILEFQNLVNRANYTCSVFTTARNSFEKKFSALKELTQQYTTNYFSKDSQSKSVSMRKEILDGVRKKIGEVIKIHYADKKDDVAPKPEGPENLLFSDGNPKPKAPINRVKK